MLFQFGYYSSLLLIFFVHGLVYSILLYRKGIRNEWQADKWLSIFLALCILYITPWMVGFGGWYDRQPYRDILFYTPFQHLFFIGPVIFFYVQSLLNPSFRFGKKEWLHLIPGLLYILFSIIMFVTDKLVLKRYFFLASQEDPDFVTWYQLAGFFSMLFYFILSLKYYNGYRKMIVQVVSYADIVLFKWVRNFLLAFLCMLVIRLLFYIFSFIPAFNSLSYAGSWWQYFSFAIIFYYIAITGYANSIETKVPFKINLLEQKKVLLLEAPLSRNAVSNTEDAEVIELEANTMLVSNEEENILKEWKPKILQYIQTEKAYEDPELSLTQMARHLKTNPTIISKAINQGFQQNFNDFVNYYRIEAVKEKLESGEQQRQTLLGIAFDCGFNSKATFNRAFKKLTGQSPKDWTTKK
jgi:AraC-like DNA-binding protein